MGLSNYISLTRKQWYRGRLHYFVWEDYVFQAQPTVIITWGGGGGGALGYFLGGYVPPGTPNWHPVLKKIPLKLIPCSRNGPIFYTPF